MTKQHLQQKLSGCLWLFALLCFAPFHAAIACNTSGYIIDDYYDNGDGTFTIEMTVLVAGGNTTSVGSTWGFYWNVDVPVISVSPPSLTSSNGTTLDAVIDGNSIAWGDPNPSISTPFLDINASQFDETFPVTVIVLGPPTEWNGGGHEGNNCPNGPGAILDNYNGEFPCQPGQGGMSELELQACDGGSVTYAGMELQAGTTTPVLLTGPNGCDSLVMVTVVGIGPELGQITLQACEGTPLFYNGVEITPGTSTEVLVSTPGVCDSLINVTALEPMPTTYGSVVLQACENETLTYQGLEILPGTSLEFVLTNSVGCDSILTVTALEPLPTVYGSDTTGICLGASIEVLGQIVTSPGIYTQSYSASNGCDSVHTTYVQLEPGPPLVMPDDFQIELGDEVSLSPSVDPTGQISFDWEPNPSLNCPDGISLDCSSPSVMPLESTVYTLVISNADGCQTEGSVAIEVVPVRRVYIPNAFSPNGDGINDELVIFSDRKSVAQINSFRVYSRWGELVFEGFNFPPNSPIFGWDGNFLSENMERSVFAYFAEIEFIDGEILLYEGEFTLLK